MTTPKPRPLTFDNLKLHVCPSGPATIGAHQHRPSFPQPRRKAPGLSITDPVTGCHQHDVDGADERGNCSTPRRWLRVNDQHSLEGNPHFLGSRKPKVRIANYGNPRTSR